MNKLSFSAYSKYVTCPKMYEMYYVQRLRPTKISSNLVFGVAMDKALNTMLLGSGDPIGVFQNEFKYEDMNNVEFDKKDLQYEVFTEEQLNDIKSQDIKYQIWACLRVKGRILLDAYRNYIYPKITEVKHVQKNLNTRVGILDAVVSIDGHDNVLVDHKTSSMPYSEESVKVSTQLALYAEDQKINKVAFIVLIKQIRFNKLCKICGVDGSGSTHKTCSVQTSNGRCHGDFSFTPDESKAIQLIIDDVSHITQNLIVTAMNETEKAIENKNFPRNLNACGKIYGKPCEYYNKCWLNSNDGLEIKEETNKEK